MIFGIGCDIIEIKRFEDSSRNPSFLEKCYSIEEIEIFEEYQRLNFLAGNFAAKEAVAKALGTGFYGILPKDIVILRDEFGKPFAKLSQNINFSGTIHISISNTKDYVQAFAVLET